MAPLRAFLARLGLADALDPHERRRRVGALEEAWRSRSSAPGVRARYLASFHQRYDAACLSGREAAFLTEEERALQEAAFAEPAARPGGVIQEAPRPAQAGGGVISGIFKEYQDRLARYARLPIGGGAEEELERLYGCLSTFEKRWLPLLGSAVGSLGGAAWRREYAELEGAFHPFTTGGTRLPSVFESYRARVERLEDPEAIQKEGQAPLRQAWQLLRQVRRLAQAVRDEPKAAEGRVTLPNGNVVSAEATAMAVLEELRQVFHDFRLKGLE